jgi:hypothetical protein
MGIPFPQPQHLPCSECGAAVERSEREEHVCDRERLLDYRMFQLRDEIAAFEGELAGYIDSPRGKFELWCAEWDRRNETGRRI